MIDAPADMCHRILAPRVAYLIGTVGRDGPDLAPMSNVTQVSRSPQIVVLAAGHQSRTCANLREGGGFTVSVPRVEHFDVVWRLGHRFSGFDPGDRPKLEASGGDLAMDLSDHGPVLSDCTGWFECETIDRVDLEEADHDVFVGRVLRGGFNERFMTDEGTYVRDASPVMQVVSNTFCSSGEAWVAPWLGPDHA